MEFGVGIYQKKGTGASKIIRNFGRPRDLPNSLERANRACNFSSATWGLLKLQVSVCNGLPISSSNYMYIYIHTYTPYTCTYIHIDMDIDIDADMVMR